MPVYAFQLSSHLAGRAVSVSPAGSDSVVASGTLDESAAFSVSLPVGDYVAVAGSGQYAYRAAGTVDQGDPDRLADSALSSTYVRKRTATFPPNAIIAHRGGAGPAPEHTMEAFRIAVASGSHALEVDCQPLGDGTLGLMHDATVDATTAATGSTTNYTAPSWRTLNAAYRFPWNGMSVPPALLSEMLSEFGGKLPILIEPKDITTATAIMDLCDTLGLEESVILEATSLAPLQAIKARGYAAYFWWGGAIGSGVTVQQAIDAGADFLGLDGTTRPDSEVTTLVNTGKPVFPFTINTRARKDQLLALGVAGVLTDQPSYLRRSTAMRTVDSWRQGIRGHGLVPVGTSGTPTLYPVQIVNQGMDLPTPASYSVWLGELSPVANAAGSYTIDFEAGFSVLGASTAAMALEFGIANDGETTFVGSSAPNGYRAYIRSNGSLNLYRMLNNAATPLGTALTTAAFTAGTLGSFRLTVTPTTVRFQRLDSAGDSGTVTDNTYRGGYLRVSKSGAVTECTPRIKSVTVA